MSVFFLTIVSAGTGLKLSRGLKRILGVVLIVGALSMIIAQAIRPASSDLYPPTEAQIYRIEADPAEGFSWPYYLYVPDQAEARADRKEAVYLLILPNNTGEPSDDLAVHRQAAREAIDQYWDIPARLGTPLLIPVFPRPWEVERERDLYVHALDRATLQTTEAELGRVDVQLTAMMDDAADRLRQQGWEVNDRALIMGFSASGMFANRFTILHPDRILAAAIGSPGGWPVAPVASWDGNTLNYPLGVNDLMTLTGQPFDLASYRRVRQLFYLGIEDDNDAVDAENRPYLSQLFGSTPVERWPYAEEIYHTTGADVEFRMDDGVGHTISSELWRYQITFFKEAMAADARSRRP